MALSADVQGFDPISAFVAALRGAPLDASAQDAAQDTAQAGAFTIAPGEAPKQIAGAGSQGEPLDQPSIDYLAARLSKGDNTALSGLGYSKVGAENRARHVRPSRTEKPRHAEDFAVSRFERDVSQTPSAR